MNPGELNRRIEVHGNKPILNELKETSFEFGKIKTVWAAIVPQGGSVQKKAADTVETSITHKITVRYSAGKTITKDMRLVYKGRVFEIDSIINPLESNEKLEINCVEVVKSGSTGIK